MRINLLRLLAFFTITIMFASCTSESESEAEAPPVAVAAGVPLELARERAERIDKVYYGLSFNIPEEKDSLVEGSATVRVHLNDAEKPLVFDFKIDGDPGLEVSRNGEAVDFVYENEHLIIPANYLQEGENVFDINFRAGDQSLNRTEDYLYTLLVPDRARTLFPCFDQPNLKARYTLELEIPSLWEASANSPLEKEEVNGDRTTLTYQETAPLSTYLFAFAAGNFKKAETERDGRRMRMLFRESDLEKAQRNLDEIFDLHAHALDWLENYTGIAYPFKKFDFVLIPTFQYGGMEHVGNIFYREGSLMLEEGATANQKLGRAGLIAHETAHMWFGDLVTMDWFNDVWLKEVFANFMAAKIVNPSFPDINHDLRFLLAHQPSAYGEDRTEGTHPIQQELENLNNAGALYGRIIYQKAPVVMRQLETMVGEEVFQQGLQSYLKKYSFDNATWDDLINILDANTELDLKSWSEVWVKEAGMPVLSAEWEIQNGAISSFNIRQEKRSEGGRYWQQQTTVSFFYPDTVKQIKVTIQGKTTTVEEAAGLPEPLAVLSGSAPISYGYFKLDEKSRDYLLTNSHTFSDPVLRGAASLALYEAFLNGAFDKRMDYFDGLMVALNEEDEPLNRQRLLSQLSTVFWRFQNETQRNVSAPVLETLLWNKLQEAEEAGAKRSYFNTYRSIAYTREAIDRLRSIYEGENQISGLRLSESDRNGLATALALRLPEEADQIIEQEIEATQNPDRKKYLAFVKPALSPYQEVRDAFFEGLKEAKNRELEPYVASALNFLHHPLRAEQSIKYILPSLQLMEEIQETGDIFFPRRWIGATLSGHSSPEAAAIVRDFLAAYPNYPFRLKNKILMASDLLFRASEQREELLE